MFVLGINQEEKVGRRTVGWEGVFNRIELNCDKLISLPFELIDRWLTAQLNHKTRFLSSFIIINANPETVVHYFLVLLPLFLLLLLQAASVVLQTVER